MNQETLLFFDKKPEALSLYETFEKKVLSEISNVTIKVQKTQISFSNKHNFAFASFLPVKKAKDRPKAFLTITFGLSRHVDSPRIHGAVEAYPNRWTHHMMITRDDEIDEEVMGWIQEAAGFSAEKR